MVHVPSEWLLFLLVRRGGRYESMKRHRTDEYSYESQGEIEYRPPWMREREIVTMVPWGVVSLVVVVAVVGFLRQVC